MAEPFQLGYIAANASATVSGILPQFLDGSSTPQNIVGSPLPVVVDASGNVQAHATASLTHITSLNSISVVGVYKLTVVVDATGLPGGNYTVAFTGATIGSGPLALPLTGSVVAVLGVTASGTPPTPPTPPPPGTPGTMSASFTTLQRKLYRFLYGIWIPANQLPLTVNSLGNGVPTDDQILDINEIIREGMMSVYQPPPLAPGMPVHQWSFLRQNIQFATTVPFLGAASDTVTIANGVVTLHTTHGTIWPANVFGTTLIASVAIPNATSGGMWQVASRTSDTVLQLSDPTVNVTPGVPFSLTYYAYQLPANFQDLIGPLTYAVGMSEYYPPIERVDEKEIRRLRATYEYTMRPTVCAISPVPGVSFSDPANTNPQLLDFVNDMQQNTFWQIEFYPTPDAAYQLTGTMRLRPFMVDATNLYPTGGNTVSQAIEAGCFAAAERLLDDQMTIYSAKFGELLAAAIAEDRDGMTPDTLGFTRDPRENQSGPRPGYPLQTNALVSYEGQVYY